jgi:hypothetical protein
MNKKKFILLPIVLFALLGLFLGNNNVKSTILLPHFNNEPNVEYIGENNGQYAYLHNYTTSFYPPFTIEFIIKAFDGSPMIILYHDSDTYIAIGSSGSILFFQIYDAPCEGFPYNAPVFLTIGNVNTFYHFVIQLDIIYAIAPPYQHFIPYKIWRNGTLIYEGVKYCYFGDITHLRWRLAKGYYTNEYASNFTISMLRVYDYWLNETEIIHNYYYPYANYITKKLRYDYHPTTYDNVLRIWYNKPNSYNRNTNLPYFILKNNDEIIYALEYATITITSTKTIPVDYTNYYCASLLFIPFAFGLLFYFVERRLILLGIGLGFMFLNLFLGVSYVYFLLGVFLIFLNIILLRYQIIEKD